MLTRPPRWNNPQSNLELAYNAAYCFTQMEAFATLLFFHFSSASLSSKTAGFFPNGLEKPTLNAWLSSSTQESVPTPMDSTPDEAPNHTTGLMAPVLQARSQTYWLDNSKPADKNQEIINDRGEELSIFFGGN